MNPPIGKMAALNCTVNSQTGHRANKHLFIENDALKQGVQECLVRVLQKISGRERIPAIIRVR